TGAPGHRDGHLHGELRPGNAGWIAGRRGGGRHRRLQRRLLPRRGLGAGLRRSLVFDVAERRGGPASPSGYPARLMTQRGTAAESEIDPKLVNKLTEEQMARFREHTPASAEYFDRARKVMPGGVPSSFQLNDPWPVYIDR